jgi:hypothetical protein
MRNQILPAGAQKLLRRFSFPKRIRIFLPFFLINFLFISFSSFGQGFSTVDFHQAQNDRNGAKLYLIDWVNGALNSTHTDYWEGIGVPQRIVMTGILPNNANANVNKHSLRFQVLASKGSKHAYDFPISWDQAFKTAEDIGGTVNELQNLFDQQCGNAFSAVAKTACDVLNAVTGEKVKTAPFPDAIGNPGKPTIGAPNVNDNITCFETYKRFGEATERYGDRTIEIRGNANISNVNVTFAGYQGSGKDYAEYLLTWESTSDQVMIRFATRLAPGNGRCGYGDAQGAGSINGAPYHVTLIRFDDVDDPSDNAPESGVSMGSQDNQIMSNAIQIPAPQCGLSNGSSGCTDNTTSFVVNYTSADAANATVKFYFTSNTAGAKLPNDVTALGNCTSNNYSVVADANGSASISISPSAGNYTAGSFRIGACVTGPGGSATCEQTSATTIHAASVVGRVNGNATTLLSPHTINSNLANQTAALTALGTLNGIQDNASFSSFVWTVASQTDAPGNIAVIGNLTGLNNPNAGDATFTPSSQGVGYQEGLYAFKVTATSSANSCGATALVFINVSGGASCPADITGPSPVCEGTAGHVYSSASLAAKNPFPEAGLTYTWSIVPSDAATITSSFVNVSSITVTAGTADFIVKVIVTNQHGEEFASTNCEFAVDVVAKPTVSAIYNPPGCSDQSFSIDIPSSNASYNYTVTQPSSSSGYNVTKAGNGGMLNFAGLALGGGFLVTVSNPGVAGSCTGSTDCAGSTNSCASESITQSKVVTDKVISTINEPAIPKPDEPYRIVLESPTKVKAVPNPYTDKIRFNLVSGVSGMGILELYNMQGQKIGVVFEGFVQAGREFTKEYVVSGAARTNLVYIFRVGDQKISGKLINQK